MSLFERFMVVNKRRHEAAVAELQSELAIERKNGEALGDSLDAQATTIAGLEAELAPFRADVEAGEAEFGIEAGAEQPAKPGNGAIDLGEGRLEVAQAG